MGEIVRVRIKERRIYFQMVCFEDMDDKTVCRVEGNRKDASMVK